MTQREITRRTLIGGAAAGAAGAALPAAAGAAKRPASGHRRADVVVVGAGLAGLTAARELAKRHKSVLVLEARDRVGGRTLNHSIGGGKIVEVGGQWVGPTQDHVLKAIKDLGLKTFKTYNDGNNVYHQNGINTPYESGGPLGPIPPDATGVPDAAKAILQINNMAATLDIDRPWTSDNAADWDSQTFETWKQNNTATPGGRNLIEVGIAAVFAAESRDLSLLWVLYYTRCGTNESSPPDLNRLFNTPDGAQDSRIVGGSQRIALEMAKRLDGKVLLRQPVRRISQGRSGVTVVSEHLTVSAKRVIVTGPPALTAQIYYEPQLPADRAQLTQRFPQGSVIKVQAVYEKPFWRDQGLTGQAVSDSGAVRVTFDNSPPDGKPGVLIGFLEGEAARIWGRKTKAQRRTQVLQDFAAYFGDDALKAKQYVEINWSNEAWTRGCYGGYLAPGVLLDYGPAIRTRAGRIHWAGTETSTYWLGYMDGAIRSGERAAKEVAAAL